jgi:hypothetical protein
MAEKLTSAKVLYHFSTMPPDIIMKEGLLPHQEREANYIIGRTNFGREERERSASSCQRPDDAVAAIRPHMEDEKLLGLFVIAYQPHALAVRG